MRELFKLFFIFAKIGAVTFGGGYAMLPLIQAEVINNGWMEESAIIDFIAVSESTPGPFAINISTYIGSVMGGDSVLGSILGSFCATLGVVLPSFIIILIVARFYDKFRESRVVKGCMSGLKPAVVGLISAAFISMAMTVFFPLGFSLSIFKDLSLYISLAILGIALVLSFKKVHPIIIICMSAVLGIAAGYLI